MARRHWPNRLSDPGTFMQAALDIAAYALGATMVVGVLLLGMLAYDIWFGDRFRTPHPEYVRLPCSALDAARDTYARMKSAYGALNSKERRLFEVHLRRMEERVQLLEQKVFEEQSPYYKAVARREKYWRGSKALHDQVRHMTRANRKRAQHVLEEAAATYRIADEGVKEEYERGVRRDKFMLDDLRALGVLEETYIPKLIDQIKAHAAKSQPDAAEPIWQEPGTEDADSPAGSARQAPQAEPRSAKAAPEGDAVVTPARVGATTYERIRDALAPLFGRKAAADILQPVPVEESTIPESAWKPAPPAPHVALPPPRPAEPVPVVTVSAPAARPPAPAPVPGLLRQQDFLGNGLVAADRSYTEPSFSVASLPRGILRQADLSRSRFSGVRFVGRHRYLDCRLAGADLQGIQLDAQGRPHQFVRCNFQGARFDASRVGFALFHECDLSGTRWNGARLERVRFSDCVMDGVEWGGAEFVETRIVSMEKRKPEPAPVATQHDELGPVAVAAESAQSVSAPPLPIQVADPPRSVPAGMESEPTSLIPPAEVQPPR